MEAMGTALEAASARGAPASSGIAGTGYRSNHYDERCKGAGAGLVSWTGSALSIWSTKRAMILPRQKLQPPLADYDPVANFNPHSNLFSAQPRPKKQLTSTRPTSSSAPPDRRGRGAQQADGREGRVLNRATPPIGRRGRAVALVLIRCSRMTWGTCAPTSPGPA